MFPTKIEKLGSLTEILLFWILPVIKIAVKVEAM